MRYIMRPFDLGVLAEFYLPKKIAYQGPLHDRLRGGLRPEVFRKHLLENKANVLPTLEGFLSRRGHSESEWTQLVEEIPGNILGGWSMYEVDGVFVDRENDRVFEERTQVVRIILYPDLKQIASCSGGGCSTESVQLLTNAFLVHGTARVSDFLRDEGDRWLPRFPSAEALHRACEQLHRWVTISAVFVFGYLVWSIADTIGTDEKVFWVTSLWNLNINQVELSP